MRSPNICVTGTLVRTDSPRSPVSALPSHFQYWTRNGSSRWYRARIAATVSGAAGRVPRRFFTMSPGAT